MSAPDPGRVKTPKGRSRRGIFVLSAPQSPSRLVIAREDMATEEERRSTCSARPSLLTRPRPEADLNCATHMCSQPEQCAHELHMVVLAKGWGLPSARLGSLRIH